MSARPWAHVAAVVDRTGGVSAATGSIRNDFLTSSDYEIGRMETNNPYNGMLDEIEVSSTRRPVEWIRTAFNNQKTPISNFKTFGIEETVATYFTTAWPSSLWPCTRWRWSPGPATASYRQARPATALVPDP